MFSTTILDTAVGLVFTFLAVSLAAGALTEALASMMKWRSTTLLAGVKALLNDSSFSQLALGVYNHALVSPRSDGTTQEGQKPKLLPAYIDPHQFAAALTEVTGMADQAPGAIDAAIAKIRNDGNTQIADLLQGICNRAGNDLTGIRDGIAKWFDSGMDRVSGAYKRRTQLFSFLIGLIVAVGLNVSAIRVALALWDQPALAKSIEVQSGLKPEEAVQKFEALNLPIGWIETSAAAGQVAHDDLFAAGLYGHHFGWWLTSMIGWLIMAGATLFGAPFWYDTLQQFVRLKGAGPSPAEKTQNKGASA
jgi:hypothetical protein